MNPLTIGSVAAIASLGSAMLRVADVLARLRRSDHLL
jgi:hypothetical protein